MCKQTNKIKTKQKKKKTSRRRHQKQCQKIQFQTPTVWLSAPNTNKTKSNSKQQHPILYLAIYTHQHFFFYFLLTQCVVIFNIRRQQQYFAVFNCKQKFVFLEIFFLLSAFRFGSHSLSLFLLFVFMLPKVSKFSKQQTGTAKKKTKTKRNKQKITKEYNCNMENKESIILKH